jgi:hypothetical protein
MRKKNYHRMIPPAANNDSQLQKYCSGGVNIDWQGGTVAACLGSRSVMRASKKKIEKKQVKSGDSH